MILLKTPTTEHNLTTTTLPERKRDLIAVALSFRVVLSAVVTEGKKIFSLDIQKTCLL